MLLWAMSDRARYPVAGSWRASASHLPVRQRGGESTFVKFHWKPRQGLQSVLGRRPSRSMAPTRLPSAGTCMSHRAGAYPQWDSTCPGVR